MNTKTNAVHEVTSSAQASTEEAPRQGVRQFLRDERGVTFTEYLVLVAGIVAIGGALFAGFNGSLQTSAKSIGERIGTVK